MEINKCPAYDLLDTRIHVSEESLFALEDDLFKEWNWSNCRIQNPELHPCKENFIEFGKTIGMIYSTFYQRKSFS